MPTQIENPILLDSGGASNVTSLNTNSISPAVGKLIVLDVFNKGPNSTLSSVPQITGVSISWVQITTHPSSFSSGEWRITRLVGIITSPVSGAISIGFSGQSQQSIEYAVCQFPNNVKLDLNNPNNSLLQTTPAENNGTITSMAISLSSFANKNNGVLAVFADDGQANFTGITGYTTIANFSNSAGNFILGFYPANDTSPTVNFSAGNAAGKVALASEVIFQANIGGFIG